MRTTTWLRATLAGTLGLMAAGSLHAQGTCRDVGAGTLGITGLACESCSFTRGREGFTEAEFLTEPRILNVERSAVGGDAPRQGDVIVAVDGLLITTAEGARRFTGIRAGERVRLTVRRDGRERELVVEAGRACELRVTTPLPPDPSMAPLPPPPPKGAATATAPLPPPPPRPTVSFGFGFRCGACGYASEASGDRAAGWFFSEPPDVYRVEPGGAADRAGFRQGDRVLAIDGMRLDAPDGARRFSTLEPGESVRWTVSRNGREVELRSVVQAPRAGVADRTDTGRLRYSGGLGPAEVEVRGAPVTVTEDPERGELVIRSADVTVIIRVPSRGG